MSNRLPKSALSHLITQCIVCVLSRMLGISKQQETTFKSFLRERLTLALNWIGPSLGLPRLGLYLRTERQVAVT